MDAVRAYLVLPSAYLEHLGGLRWGASEDAIEYPDGRTFLLREPLAQFVDGFGSERDLINIGHVLHVIDLFTVDRRTQPHEHNWLCLAMRQPGVTYRNLGVFAAHLTKEVPGTARPVAADQVWARLINPLNRPLISVMFTTDFSDAVESLPPLAPETFEKLILQELTRYSVADVNHSLRHGRAPEKPSLVPPLPKPAWEATQDRLLERERMRGAVPFITPLLSALTLPPRRMAKDDLPLGGYADVTNHGRIEALLPAQFALDADDFLRRFAEQELLYFRREDPLVTPLEDLLIVLDQGVRTWGDVRHRLTAAALVLILQGIRQERGVYLTTSGTAGKWYHPLETPVEELATVLEASDLTPCPVLALQAAKDQCAVRTRDVVVLTHPRTLDEAEVIAAHEQLAPLTRVFALAVDEASEAMWSQLRHGRPTRTQRFALRPVSEPTPARPKHAREVRRRFPGIEWTGNAGGPASPFQVPTRGTAVACDFDTEDRWFFVLDSLGILYAWDLEHPGRVHVLPSAVVDAQPISRMTDLLGVPDGVIVRNMRVNQRFFFAHYRMRDKKVRAGEVTNTLPAILDADMMYEPMLNQVVLHQPLDGWSVIYQLNHGRVIQEDHHTVGNRLRGLPRRDGALPLEPLTSAVTVELPRYNVRVVHPRRGEINFIPYSDGKPRYVGQLMVEAQVGASTLCLRTHRLREQFLVAYDLKNHAVLGEWSGKFKFKLSPSGRLLARQVTDQWFTITDLYEHGRLTMNTRGGMKVRIKVMMLGAEWLYVSYNSRSSYLIEWRDELTCTYRKPAPPEAAVHHTLDRPEGAVWGPTLPSDAPFSRVYLNAGLKIVADELGQVWIYDADERLACVFLLDQTDIAGWTPNGDCFGPPRLLGTTATPDALDRFARVLRAATVRPFAAGLLT